MLIYHFGSREGLLAAVVNRIEAQQRQALAELADRDDDLLEVCRAFWRRISDPALAPAERLFFEVYASALHRRPWAEPFRESVVSAWDAPLTALFARHGFAPEQARDQARLALAVARGLLLDLLVTEENRAVNRAAELFATLVSARRPHSRLGRSTAAR
jgi:AcrR family transcriptional regulator